MRRIDTAVDMAAGADLDDAPEAVRNFASELTGLNYHKPFARSWRVVDTRVESMSHPDDGREWPDRYYFVLESQGHVGGGFVRVPADLVRFVDDHGGAAHMVTNGRNGTRLVVEYWPQVDDDPVEYPI